jgi:hypothetical protein
MTLAHDANLHRAESEAPARCAPIAQDAAPSGSEHAIGRNDPLGGIERSPHLGHGHDHARPRFELVGKRVSDRGCKRTVSCAPC